MEAKYTAIEYTVAFDPNGGTGTMAEIKVTVEKDFDPGCAFVRVNYTFAGWSYSADGPGISAEIDPAEFDATTLRCTAYALWEGVPCTVTYKISVNKASGATETCQYSAETYPYGSEQRIIGASLEGYSVSGWTTTDTAVGADGKYTVDKDIVFTAAADPNLYSYTVKYMAGSVVLKTVSNLQAKFGASVTPEILAFTGYTAPTESKTIEIGTDPSKNTVVYEYVAKLYRYTVKYEDDYGNTLADDVTGTGAYGTYVEAELKTIAGYKTPLRWSIKITDSETDNVYTYYYSVDYFTITFDTDGGSAISAITQGYGTPITAPETVPEKTGHTFRFWSKDGTSEYGFTTMPPEDITLKAVWEANLYGYTVKYRDAGGKKIADDATGTADFGTEVDAELKTIAGYTAPAAGKIAITEVSENNVKTYTYTITMKNAEGRYVPETGMDEAAFTGDQISSVRNDAAADPGVDMAVSVGESTVYFGNEALKSLRDGAATLSVTVLTDVSREIRNIIGESAPVYRITFGSNSEFGSPVTVTVPYTPDAGKSGDGLRVYYLKDGAVAEKIDCRYADGKVSFDTTHFSDYAVVWEEPSSSGGFPVAAVIAAIAAIAVLAVAGFIFIQKKKSA